MAAADQALAQTEVPDPGPDAGLVVSSGRFSMRTDVHGGPDGTVSSLLRVDGGRATLAVAGDDEDADVTVALAYSDARALMAGQLVAAEAIAGGRVRVRGDLSVLAGAQALLASLAPALAQVRGDTEP